MDLFEPGTGSRAHDFTGGIPPSGLVWTVPIADDAIVLSHGGRRLDVNIHDVPVIDATPAELPAMVSFRMTWRGRGPVSRIGQGDAVAATDPAAFRGRFFRARATGTFSGTAGAFSFHSNPERPVRSIFAELGTEQAGALLAGNIRCAACARIAQMSVPRR